MQAIVRIEDGDVSEPLLRHRDRDQASLPERPFVELDDSRRRIPGREGRELHPLAVHGQRIADADLSRFGAPRVIIGNARTRRRARSSARHAKNATGPPADGDDAERRGDRSREARGAGNQPHGDR